MQRLLGQRQVGSSVVQVWGVSRTESFIGGASETVEDYVLVINGHPRHDLGAIGASPEALLDIGADAVQGGY